MILEKPEAMITPFSNGRKSLTMEVSSKQLDWIKEIQRVNIRNIQ